MSDLISKQAVIELIESKCTDGCLGNEDLTLIDAAELLDDVDSMPVVYDVDKVVEQLEQNGRKMSEAKSMQKYGKSSPANHRYYKSVSVKRAIEIVKGGGVNE